MPCLVEVARRRISFQCVRTALRLMVPPIMGVSAVVGQFEIEGQRCAMNHMPQPMSPAHKSSPVTEAVALDLRAAMISTP